VAIHVVGVVTGHERVGHCGLVVVYWLGELGINVFVVFGTALRCESTGRTLNGRVHDGGQAAAVVAMHSVECLV
jgi:hypothetical protein